jgi:predicted ATPase
LFFAKYIIAITVTNSNSDKNKWSIELDKWVDYIFPGVAVEIIPSGGDLYQMKMLGSAATNVGFGITYALPILVSGLTVPNDGILIVENPEAHLHAKAQSNMGYFLARMAAAGVRVIIETHSEHIVNGIRRMIVEGKSEMSHEDMTIYFFQNKDGEKDIKEITMDYIGNLSEFPVDFFDQVRQDMLELMKLERKRKGMKDGEW